MAVCCGEAIWPGAWYRVKGPYPKTSACRCKFFELIAGAPPRAREKLERPATLDSMKRIHNGLSMHACARGYPGLRKAVGPRSLARNSAAAVANKRKGVGLDIKAVFPAPAFIETYRCVPHVADIIIALMGSREWKKSGSKRIQKELSVGACWSIHPNRKACSSYLPHPGCSTAEARKYSITSTLHPI